jgi:hypothetical protein
VLTSKRAVPAAFAPVHRYLARISNVFTVLLIYIQNNILKHTLLAEKAFTPS